MMMAKALGREESLLAWARSFPAAAVAASSMELLSANGSVLLGIATAVLNEEDQERVSAAVVGEDPWQCLLLIVNDVCQPAGADATTAPRCALIPGTSAGALTCLEALLGYAVSDGCEARAHLIERIMHLDGAAQAGLKLAIDEFLQAGHSPGADAGGGGGEVDDASILSEDGVANCSNEVADWLSPRRKSNPAAAATPLLP
ncbi:unnamed protein product, partial [Phaeothamnion confervicola]